MMEVIALAQANRIHAEVETFPLDQAVQVYQRLHDGKIRGRAVLQP
jgi:propanol-preferring alcohol dehydrogenase